MSAEWFYTTNKQQMGPVTWDELRELAEVGLLKPHDLVWTEGMAEWVKAINQGGLFAEEGETAGSSKKSNYTQSKPPPGRRTRKKDDVDEDEEEDGRKSKKSSRQKEEERYKMGVGIRIVLTLGGVLLLLVLLAGCVGAMIWVALPSGKNAGPVNDNWVWNNLAQGKHLEKEFRFTQGKRVTVTVINNLQNGNTNVDLLIFRGDEQNQAFAIFSDRRPPNMDRNCQVQFQVPATDRYRVRVANFGPGQAHSCQVTVTEH